MKVLGAIEGHNSGVVSISRAILGVWFLFVLTLSIVSLYKSFWGGGLPSDIETLYDFVMLSSGIFAGNYVGREGTKVMGRNKPTRRRRGPSNESYE